MLNDLLLLGDTLNTIPSGFAETFLPHSTHVAGFASIKTLIEHLLITINFSLQQNMDTKTVDRVSIVDSEKEIDYTVVIYIHPDFKFSDSNNSLNNLSKEKFVSLIHYRFLHLNPIILSDDVVTPLSNDISIIQNNINSRLLRVNSWIGFPINNINSTYLNSMPNYLNLSPISDDDLSLFTLLLSTEIIYDDLLINLNIDDNELISSFIKWDFNAFKFNIDELLQIGYLILKKYNKVENANNLKSLLFFVRDNYRLGNPFHNFRHAIDVLQAANVFLNSLTNNSNFKITDLDCFSLLLASLGHDIGHPGITNLFLSNVKSPLSDTFENNSILEKFHKFQFKNILLPFLNLSIELNNFTIQNFDLSYLVDIVDNSVLATDMAKHDDFVKEINKLQYQFDNFKLLACLLIKCADISNVCRLLNPSCKWGLSLGEEFKQIAILENYFKSDRTIDIGNDQLILHNFNKQIKDIDAVEGVQLVKGLSDNQKFFINRFAIDFFSRISETIPQIAFLIDNLNDNFNFWDKNSNNKN